jgi:type II secretory pathway component PulF
MPLYEYQAIDKRGRNLTGVMPAEDELSLDGKLKDAGLWLTDANITWPKTAANNPNAPVRRFRLRGSRGRRELIDFCTLMTFQIRAGITVVKALEVACNDCKNDGFKEVLVDMQRQIEGGLRFHEAMAFYPGTFSKHFLTVIKAGETTSNLPESFNDLKEYLDWVDKMMADVRQATLYPAIVSTVITGFTIFLFTYIIPKFAALLTSLKVQQPLLTQIVFGVGDFAQKTWWLWAPLFLFTIFFFAFGRRISPKIGYAVDYAKLHVPIFGELNGMLALSRFAHNLSILYRSGLPIIQCLEMCQEGLVGNMVVEKAVEEVAEDVKTGSTISEAMHRHNVFTALLLRMVSMGETSGNLDKALDNVAEYYNDVIPRRIKAVFSIMEPALMLFLIFMVGCVALAIYLPIISLMGAVK